MELYAKDFVPAYDYEVRFMKSEKGNSQISYNFQTSVDYDTKIICALNVVRDPTDHYQLPGILDKTINNTKYKLKNVSADTIYLNSISLSYLANNNNINGFIPNRKQSKEKIGKLNLNPYHKDHFTYNLEKDCFICPEGEELSFYREYRKPNKDKNKSDIIERKYSNYHACKHCKARNKCISAKFNQRIITENGDTLQRAMRDKMELKESKEEYSKRSCVEGLYGVLKEQFGIEKEVVMGLKNTEDRLHLDVLAYNLRRLYNLEQENNMNNKEDIVKFCEHLSATEKLTLDTKIW